MVQIDRANAIVLSIGLETGLEMLMFSISIFAFVLFAKKYKTPAEPINIVVPSGP